jgi:hypothetical protein
VCKHAERSGGPALTLLALEGTDTGTRCAA